MSDRLVQDRANLNHDLLKMIFSHLRYQLKRSIDENVSIDQDITTFINNKVCAVHSTVVCLLVLLVCNENWLEFSWKQLAAMKLEIGIPSNILKDEEYLNKFYKDFYWRKLHFSDNLEYYWMFMKKKMEMMLEPMNATDKWVSIFVSRNLLLPMRWMHKNNKFLLWTFRTIANLYSVTGNDDSQLVHYSIDLNTIIVSNRALDKPFFHYKYPM